MKHINDPATISLAKSGDEEAMNTIVESNMGLVKSIAVRFVGRGTDMEDLIQLGSIGLIKAVRGFDEGYGCSFSTYAVPLITGEIKRFLRDDGPLKVSRAVKQNAVTVRRFSDEFEKLNNREPTIDEISAACNISHEDIITALDSSRPILAFGSSDDEHSSVEELVGEDLIEKSFEGIALREAIKKLKDSERLLIEMRYFRGLTQQQTAQVLSMSQVKVSREERRINRLLRDLLTPKENLADL